MALQFLSAPAIGGFGGSEVFILLNELGQLSFLLFALSSILLFRRPFSFCCHRGCIVGLNVGDDPGAQWLDDGLGEAVLLAKLGCKLQGI